MKNGSDGRTKPSSHSNSKVYYTSRNKGNHMNWIPVTERLPEITGSVLVHRITNESQKPMAISILPANQVKYCEDDAHWMSLPQPPEAK